MVIEQNTVIGGEIVGIGKIRADGSEEFTWMKNPIHNQITTKGIDNLLMWNGSSVTPSTGIGNEISSLYLPCQSFNTDSYNTNVYDSRDTSVTRTGVLYYSAYGDGRGNIDPETATDLINKISNYSTTFRRGNYFNGSNCVSTSGNHQLQFRCTHTYPAATEHQNVNEIGFYHKVEPSGNYTLFSRVQLDNTYELEIGESLIITYQLNVKYPNQPRHIDDFFGLLDTNGNTLQANETTCIKAGGLNWESSYRGNCVYYWKNRGDGLAPFSFPIINNYYPWGLPSYAYKYYTTHDGYIQYGWRPVWGLKKRNRITVHHDS